MTNSTGTNAVAGVSELLPCPFCGGEVHMTELDDEDDRRMWVRYVECETCDLKMRDWTGWPKGTFERQALSDHVEKSLTAMWNRRAALSCIEAGPGEVLVDPMALEAARDAFYGRYGDEFVNPPLGALEFAISTYLTAAASPIGVEAEPVDVHDLKARINVLLPAMQDIRDIALGSTTANSLPHIAKVAATAIFCQEPFNE